MMDVCVPYRQAFLDSVQSCGGVSDGVVVCGQMKEKTEELLLANKRRREAEVPPLHAHPTHTKSLTDAPNPPSPLTE